MSRGRSAAEVCVAIALALAARDAAAGDFVEDKIVAATEDGAYQAGYETSDGSLVEGSCDMRKVGGNDPPVVKANCAGPGKWDVLPFAKWQWVNPTADVRRLKEFEAAGVEKIARVTYDFDTRLHFAEIFHGGSWIRVRLFEDDNPREVSGVLKGSDRYVVRLHESTGQLQAGDDLWVPTFAEVADEKGRYERALKEAQDDSARMREHRKQGDAVFAPPPAGTKKEKWEQRRRHGIARFLRKWEIVAVLRPLSAANLKDTLWLLAWLDSPVRRYESLRLYDGVRGRDPKGASAVVDALAADPDTRALADYLKTTKDWARNLPMAGEELTPALLRDLSAEQLLWLRRSMQVRVGYHMDDPAVRQYFEGLGWYSPMSDRKWKKLTSDPAWKTNPDAVLLRVLKDDERGKQNLLLLKQAEARHSAAAPR